MALYWRELAPLLLFQNRRRAQVFLWVAALNAIFEWLAVCSIYPLVALCSQPQTLNQAWLQALHQSLGAPSPERFQLLMGTAFMLIFLSANLLNALTYWLHLRYTLGLRHALSLHLLRVYLHKDYAWLLRQHTSDLVKNVLAEMDRIVYEMLAKVSTLVYRGLTAIMILAGLIVVNPLVALSSAFVLGCAYQIIYVFFRGEVERLGQRRLALNQLRHRLVQEALSALKEGRLLSRRDWLDRDFARSSLEYVKAESNQRLIAELPRHLTELLAVLAILLVFGFYIWRSGGALAALPVMGLYVLAIWRLIPALQEVYSCWVDVGYAWPSLRAFLPLLSESVSAHPAQPLPWVRQLALRQVSFTYPEAERPALREVTLEIERGSLVGLVGRTGSGKTSSADLLGGFLSPTQGSLELDGQILDEQALASWRQQVGYVPQTIYLSDHSVAANIAYGYPAEEIDQARVREVARLAQIDLRIQALPQQYASVVGERGLTLSGGERQRLGLARALYSRPDLLILDEATSALDAVTESQVLDSLRQQQGKQTILMISHRLSSLRACSKIAVFCEGRLVSQGSFAELEKSCPVFQSLLSGDREDS